MKKVLSFSEFCNETLKVPYITSSWLDRDRYKYLKLGKNTAVEKILRFIFDSGKDGRTRTEILTYLFEDIRGSKYDKITNRGVYSSLFTNVLSYFADNSTKKWILTDPILIDYFSEKLEDAESKISNELDTLLDTHHHPKNSELNRIRISQHPNISDETLVALAMNDPSEKVRAAAKKNPRFKKIKGIDFLEDIGIV